jgi:hypothetical protein
MEMPKPGAGHEKLHVFAGEWDGDEVMMPSPMGAGGPAKGRLSARVGIDGLFVIGDYEQSHDGVVGYRGHSVYGYDTQAGQWTWYWVDSMGMPSVPSRGTWEGDTLTFESTQGGGKTRFVYRWEGRDKHHFHIEGTFDGGATWNKFMEGVYVRKQLSSGTIHVRFVDICIR